MHSSCYDSVQSCHHKNQTYLTAILKTTRRSAVQTHSHNSPLSASCAGMPGKPVCWKVLSPIHVSDGGGPSDRAREQLVQQRIEQLIEYMYPSLKYHPLALPKPRGIDLNSPMSSLLKETHKLLNLTNPDLASNCWLCLPWGIPMPLAILTPSITQNLQNNNHCSLSSPFKVQPVSLDNITCLYQRFQNNSYDIDLGNISFSHCSEILVTNVTNSILCPPKDQIFVCGTNMAYTSLPTNWPGQCTTASPLPDISLVDGKEPVPLPTFDYYSIRHKSSYCPSSVNRSWSHRWSGDRYRRNGRCHTQI